MIEENMLKYRKFMKNRINFNNPITKPKHGLKIKFDLLKHIF